MFRTLLMALIILLSTLFVNSPHFADSISHAIEYDLNLTLKKAKFIIEDQQIAVKGRVETNNSEPVNVELWDDDLNLLLDSQSTDKHFSFIHSQSLHSTFPCNIRIKVGQHSIVKSVEKAPDDCGKYKTTISGVITDQPIPFATVSVTLGGQTFTTVADENGAYSLDVISVLLDELVLIEADAINNETGDPINFVNLAGTFSKVLSDPVENVTNVTTAKYTLVLEANGGTVPTTLQELQTAETAVDASELFELAAVIKLIVDDPQFTLPEGYSSLLDFIADGTAVEAFKSDVALVDPDLLSDTLAIILSDSNLVPGFDEATLPDQYIVLPAVNPGYLARSGSIIELDKVTNEALILSYNRSSGQNASQEFNWAISNGRLELNPINPTFQEGFADNIEVVTDDPVIINAYYEGGGTADGFNFNYSLQQINYTRVVDGNLVDFVSTETRALIQTQPIHLSNGALLTVPDFIQISNSNQTFRSINDVTTFPFTTTCLVNEVCAFGKWGGNFHFAYGVRSYDDYIYPNTSYGEVLKINSDNTVTGSISEVTATWLIDSEGQLVINYADGMQQTVHLIDNLGLEYGALSIFDDGVNRFALYNIWVRGDENFNLTQSLLLSPASKYWNGEVNLQTPGSFDENGELIPKRRFGWKFLDGTNLINFNNNVIADNDGDGISDNGLLQIATQGYSFEPERVLIDRFSYAKRYWYPLASEIVDGNRILYLMEYEDRDAQIWFGWTPGFRPYIPARVNIFRERDEFTDWDYITDITAQ